MRAIQWPLPGPGIAAPPTEQPPDRSHLFSGDGPGGALRARPVSPSAPLALAEAAALELGFVGGATLSPKQQERTPTGQVDDLSFC